MLKNGRKFPTIALHALLGPTPKSSRFLLCYLSHPLSSIIQNIQVTNLQMNKKANKQTKTITFGGAIYGVTPSYFCGICTGLSIFYLIYNEYCMTLQACSKPRLLVKKPTCVSSRHVNINEIIFPNNLPLIE